MKVVLVTATNGRHKHLERLVRFVLSQTSDDWTHLIFNNSHIPQRLNKNLDSSKFLLVNQHLSSITNKPYTSLGEIYTDILQYIPEDCDVVNFLDDDDIYLPNHVEEGLKGLERGGKLAYKPFLSWFKYLNKKPELVNNTLEPSIFVKKSHILEKGFSPETTAQHLHWLNPLITSEQIFEDKEGRATFCCDWSQEIPTFKTSGNPNNPDNFDNYSSYSQDFGDRVITPMSESWAKHYSRGLK